jgi:hypothetical protein
VRWAVEEATLAYFNPHPTPLVAGVKLELVGVSERDVVLEQNGRAVRTVRVGEVPVTLELPALRLDPGVNRFTLRSHEPAKRLSAGRYQLRAFGLKNSLIRAEGSLPGGERTE